MTRRNKAMVPIPAELVPRGQDDIAAEYKAMIAKIVERTGKTSSDWSLRKTAPLCLVSAQPREIAPIVPSPVNGVILSLH